MFMGGQGEKMQICSPFFCFSTKFGQNHCIPVLFKDGKIWIDNLNKLSCWQIRILKWAIEVNSLGETFLANLPKPYKR